MEKSIKNSLPLEGKVAFAKQMTDEVFLFKHNFIFDGCFASYTSSVNFGDSFSSRRSLIGDLNGT